MGHLAQNGLVVAGKVVRHAGHIYLNPKSGDGTPPVGFVGRMGGIGSLFEPPGGRLKAAPSIFAKATADKQGFTEDVIRDYMWRQEAVDRLDKPRLIP